MRTFWFNTFFIYYHRITKLNKRLKKLKKYYKRFNKIIRNKLRIYNERTEPIKIKCDIFTFK